MTQNVSDHHPKRRWMQISLKSLLWLTVAVAAFFSGYSVAMRKCEARIASSGSLNRAREDQHAVLQAELLRSKLAPTGYETDYEEMRQMYQRLKQSQPATQSQSR
jgi:hypothetical protein